MIHSFTTLRVIALTSALLLHGCGGGGGGEVAGIDRGGEKPDLSVTGPINGFGSVIVNGVHYNTDNAAIYVRGELVDEQQLDVGYYVTLVGRIDNAGEYIAHEVHYQPKVTGPVESKDVMRNRITVMGQVIQLVQDTSYGSSVLPRNIEGLDIGDVVSVSGVADSDNVIRASRVEQEAMAEAEVAGTITRLDAEAQVFYLNQLRVDYAFASLATSLTEGQPVVVRGMLEDNTADEVIEPAFNARTITFNTDYRLLTNIPTIRFLEFRGYVAGLRNGQFEIDGVPARISTATAFSGGTVQDLENNDQIRAHGSFVDGVLQIEYLHFIKVPVMQAFGGIDEIIDQTALPETGSDYLGAITVGGFTYYLRAETRLEGDLGQHIGFGHLETDHTVYVSAYSEGDRLVAASLAVDNRDWSTMSLEPEGKAVDIDVVKRQFSILHHRIQTTDGYTVFGEKDLLINEAQFYEMLTDPKATVRVRGSVKEGVLIAAIAQVSTNGFAEGYTLFPKHSR